MTEEEWLGCADPAVMLKFLRGRTSDRKLRLFAVACCRRIFHLFTDKRDSQKTIEFAERFADGRAAKNELRGNAWGKPGQAFTVVHYKASEAAEETVGYCSGMVERSVLAADEELFKTWEHTLDTACVQQGWSLSEAIDIANASMPEAWIATGKLARAAEQKGQSLVLQDIFGNPLRPVMMDSRWLTSTVVDLARTIYEEKAFARMPILADALMDAGCDHADILEHCRGSPIHARGCWVVDLLLGKS